MSQQLAVQSEPRITQGTLRTSTGKVLPLEHTEVQARVDGPVATVEVRQRFLNDTGGPIEATYLRLSSTYHWRNSGRGLIGGE